MSLYLQGHMITGTQLRNGKQQQVYRENIATTITATESNIIFEGNITFRNKQTYTNQ